MRTSTDTDCIYYITTRTEKKNPVHVYVVIKRVRCSDITEVSNNADAFKICTCKSSANVSANMIYFTFADVMKCASIMQHLLSATQLLSVTGSPSHTPICEIVIEDMK